MFQSCLYPPIYPFIPGLVEFLDSLHPGRLVALAVRDEGSFNLKDKARQKLASLGSKHVRRERSGREETLSNHSHLSTDEGL